MLEHRCSLPVTGSVLGIDVGWSPKRPTTGLSLIEWNQHEVRHISDVVGIDEINRRTMIRKMTDARTLLGVGIDGPLVPGLQTTNKYRTAEALLSRGKFQRRGKPGPVNGGSGPCLHRKATELAKLSLSLCDVSFATHPYSIHERAVVEAFPNAFLSVLQPEEVFSQIPKKHRPWTDVLLPYTKPIIRRLLLDVLLPRHELIFDYRIHHAF